MIAYNKIWLGNLVMQHDLKEARHEDLITADEYNQTIETIPVGFYSPGILVKTGFFLLTCVITAFSAGIFLLLFMDSLEKSIGGLLLYFSIACYLLLEYFAGKKGHFHSGVDDALIWLSGVFFITAINNFSELSMAGNVLLICIVSTWFVIRFADPLMALVSASSFMAWVFLNFIKIGSLAEALAPFLMMFTSACVYFFFIAYCRREQSRYYVLPVMMFRIAGLLFFYSSANYFVIRELSIEFLHKKIAPGESFPLGWLFWCLTILIPLVYIITGLYKKESLILRCGMLLVAAMVFTVRNYYHVIPAQFIMIGGGLILILIAYLISRYFEKPKFGFSILESRNSSDLEKLNIEGILVAETMGGSIAPDKSSFGGGSFGGAGASGEF